MGRAHTRGCALPASEVQGPASLASEAHVRGLGAGLTAVPLLQHRGKVQMIVPLARGTGGMHARKDEGRMHPRHLG